MSEDGGICLVDLVDVVNVFLSKWVVHAFEPIDPNL
jgi:hypothetical protein